ncbi:MAG: transglycosylase domain-containing protein [Bradymonadales bacterium]|nr:transglycosylase domain-containing protein [Bradymonadales bacterium]
MLQLANSRSSWGPAILMRALWVLLFWFPLPVTLGVAVVYGALQASLPPAPDILVGPPGSATVVRTLDGQPVGGLQRGLAPWVYQEELPPVLVEAFLAAEDDDFFLHRGVDLRSIARAAIANLRSGAIRQGGSTITQQVAKMFVGTSRTYQRKLLELLVARRIEAAYTKWEILECYLNRVYLGAGAHGVVAAAHIYFDRSLAGLTLVQSATLAGIASAPSAFEPYDYPERALRRRNIVLDRMEALSFIDPETARQAREQPLVLRERGEIPPEPMSYVSASIRSELLRQYGPDAWRYGGLTAITPVSPILQRFAERALWAGVTATDMRQGYRGPLRRELTLQGHDFFALVKSVFPTDQAYQPALVRSVDQEGVAVWVDGREALLGRESWRWAFPFDEQSDENSLEVHSATEILRPGDLILLQRQEDAGGYRLVQYPRLEGALAAMDLDTGYLRAMAAGVDPDRSQFNRVLHGCRQPGSVFKPVIYSLALERGFTVATPLVDVPLRLPQGGREVWTPRNADGRFMGRILLREALIWSRNLPTISLFHRVGVRNVVERAAALGFTTTMEPTDALSLGASCVLPVDVVTAYGVFANGGRRQRPQMVVSVVDGQGTLLMDSGVPHDAAGSASAMLVRADRRLSEEPPLVLHPRTAYLVRYLLQEVINLGTGYQANLLGAPAAGKTGTTTAYDAWFTGFTRDLVSVVWVGSDRNTRPLGRGETGSAVALPIWVEFMTAALAGRPQASLIESVPPGIAFHRVDLETGLLSQEGASGAWLPFVQGSEPNQYAPTREQRDMAQADRVDDRF